jgi:uncharacterized protein YjiS (DUF1127 family)
MERVLVKTSESSEPFGKHERSTFPSLQIVDRAREARAETLREFFIWLDSRTAATAKRWVEFYRARRARREAIRELQSLDSRMLRDIGVGRSEIEWRVSGGDDSRSSPLPVAKPRAAASAARNRRRETEKRAA